MFLYISLKTVLSFNLSRQIYSRTANSYQLERNYYEKTWRGHTEFQESKLLQTSSTQHILY